MAITVYGITYPTYSPYSTIPRLESACKKT
jgi:hypothetical protein